MDQGKVDRYVDLLRQQMAARTRGQAQAIRAALDAAWKQANVEERNAISVATSAFTAEHAPKLSSGQLPQYE